MAPDERHPVPDGVCEELGFEPGTLDGATFGLMASGEDLVDPAQLDLVVVDPDDPDELTRVPVPLRFLRFEGRQVIDVAALVAWLGLGDEAYDDLPSTVSPTFDAVPDEEGLPSTQGEWLLEGTDDEDPVLWLTPAPPPPDLPALPPDLLLPSVEEGEVLSSGGETKGPTPIPALGDTDAWPDDVEGWLAVIDQLQRNATGTLRAADVRALFGGHDDTVLELTPEGPVDQEGNLVGPDADTEVDDDTSSWDPATDSLDPALEEAMRIRGLPGAKPPPEPLPAATAARPAAVADEAEDDLPAVEIDNRTVIVDEPDEEDAAWGCLGLVARGWGVAAAVGILALLAIGFFVFSGDGGDDADEVDAATPAEAEAEQTAAEALEQATQELLDARTAEVEQQFGVVGPSGPGQSVSATGGVDFGAASSQTTLESEGTTFTAFVSPDAFGFNTGTGWVITEPGEVAASDRAEQAGLTPFAIAEAMDPAGMAALLSAAEGVERTGDGAYRAMVTLPVPGAEVLVHGVYGNPQEDLAGLMIPLDVAVGTGPTLTVEAEFALEDAIEFLPDDPLAATLTGVVLTNETVFVDPGADPGVTGPTPDARDLETLLGQLGA